MRGAFELLGEATSDGRIIRNLFDEVDIGKAIFSELANYAERVLDDARVQRKRSWVFKLDLRKLMILEKMLWVEVGKLDFWVFLLQLFGENECQV